MKNNSLLFILSILFSLSALTFSCSSGGDGGDNNGGGGSQQVIPSNLDVNVTIQGQVMLILLEMALEFFQLQQQLQIR